MRATKSIITTTTAISVKTYTDNQKRDLQTSIKTQNRLETGDYHVNNYKFFHPISDKLKSQVYGEETRTVFRRMSPVEFEALKKEKYLKSVKTHEMNVPNYFYTGFWKAERTAVTQTTDIFKSVTKQAHVATNEFSEKNDKDDVVAEMKVKKRDCIGPGIMGFLQRERELLVVTGTPVTDIKPLSKQDIQKLIQFSQDIKEITDSVV
jgi:hypothetical protein